MRSDASLLLLSELAYQSGASFYKTESYQGFLEAYSARDTERALTEFKSTAAYKASGPERRRHYLELVKEALE